MVAWGALDIDSDEAVREVFDHTVVASIAYISRQFDDSACRLGIVWFRNHGPAETGAEPAAPLRRMAETERALREAGAVPHWHGRDTFVWVVDAATRDEAADLAVPVARAAASRGMPISCGVAHGAEVADPVDLIRLAAHRSRTVGDEHGAGEERLSTIPMEVLLSPGERARLELIAKNRGRDVEPLVREAIDLLLARYA
jgi:hypothetical protein